MLLSKCLNYPKVAMLALLCAAGGAVQGQQVCHNMFPYVQGVVSDNNGYDLAGFIQTNAKDVKAKAARIDQYSNGTWGYLQVKGARVPSVDIKRVNDKYAKNHLNYSETIDATFAMADTKEGMKATWWTRQCNNKNGPLFYKKADGAVSTSVPIVYYSDITKELAVKKFTLVECDNGIYNRRDYDQLLKNYVTIDHKAIKDGDEYKAIIDFYNGFLTKFSYVDDPLLEDKSFITFFSNGKNKYVGYFNIENSKLSGHLDLADLQYPADEDSLINNTFKKLTRKTVFVYGETVFGMDKKMLRYGSVHNLRMIRRKPGTTKKFNAA